ncbi:putative serum paraoxonase/arylesterase 2 [Tricladium varicosporioides]|nr:putative serum paraoxonase/arylesterase 2 [Hymenoscyphus varicosporioides]
MVNLVSKAAIVSAVVVGVLYQFVFKTLLFDVLGYGRKVWSIKDFNNVKCEKIDELGLEGCEDMWLHEKTGYLYMACSDTRSRQQWLPAINHLNASGRGLTDRIAVLDTRGEGRLASRIQWLDMENFSGNNGDGRINLHGLDIRADKHTGILRILAINHRPPINPVTGELLDATKVGANSTIEQFMTKAGSSTMRHVRTYVDEVIKTPNRVAWVNEDAFVFSNDNSAKVGSARRRMVLVGGGSVGYCRRNRCNIAHSSDFNFPNGLVVGRDGLIYVPNTLRNDVHVFSLQQNHSLKKVHTIKVPFPIDNLSVDSKGDIYAAAFPRLYMWMRATKKPFEINPPSAVLKITRGNNGYKGPSRKAHSETWDDGDYTVETVLEDDGSVLPGSTVAVYDAATKKMYLGGSMSPFITICENV